MSLLDELLRPLRRSDEPKGERTVTGGRVSVVATVKQVQSTRASNGEQHLVELVVGNSQVLRLNIPKDALPRFPAGGRVRLVVEPY